MSDPDPYTMEFRLCDDQGMVSHERHSEDGKTFLEMLYWLSSPGTRRVTEPFQCTGHAHLGTQHIRCTSPAHEEAAHRSRPPAPSQAAVTTRAEGRALLRIAADLREFVKGEDVPDSLLQDIETMERIGQWLSAAQTLTTVTTA